MSKKKISNNGQAAKKDEPAKAAAKGPGQVLSASAHGPGTVVAVERSATERLRRVLRLSADVSDEQVLAEAAERLERLG
ncbi:MAG TPA: hypothetical protein PLL65_21015 [Phycisphaerae bacterium]|nr:hypothetical protein [Phycisphaerae bacterium]HOM53793.1 hypothetical protein [Phycisphaerae bacterium]